MSHRWSREKASEWYRGLPWMVGCNFIASTAINQLEMWQADTWDPLAIERELTRAAGLGFNTVRVYLHDLVWASDAEGLRSRMERFLAIASSRGIRPLFVFFDDCWNGSPSIGKQPEPIPGVHNSGWVKSPGNELMRCREKWTVLEEYVKDVTRHFGDDHRVLAWDLYNEPGNGERDSKALELLALVFSWARAADPSQPLTSGVWSDDRRFRKLQLELSDIVSFHSYGPLDDLHRTIAKVKRHGRPVLCTEYMARTRESLFRTHLPVLKEQNVGCYNWGLVAGKTNTIYPWGSKQGSPEPRLWFHDILRPDGSAFDPDEVSLIRGLTRT